MRDKFGSMIVSTFAFPQQVFFCRDEISSLADLKGKKVRVQGVSQSDLVKALGGSAVTIPFGEVVPALEKGVVDCGITGTLPGYQAKWPEVVKTVVDVSLGYTAGFVAVNLNSWNKLSKPTQEFMTGAVQEARRGVLGQRRGRHQGRHRLRHRQRPVLGRHRRPS